MKIVELHPLKVYPFTLNSLIWNSGPGCSKLTMSLVNVLLKFQTFVP